MLKRGSFKTEADRTVHKKIRKGDTVIAIAGNYKDRKSVV